MLSSAAVPSVLLGRQSNSVRIGLVGIPNVGKSTLFNLLCHQSVPAENYPFCTVEPNRANARVDDPRFASNDFSRDRIFLSLSQMIFDGFATRNEVARLGHAARRQPVQACSAEDRDQHDPQPECGHGEADITEDRR